MKYGRYGWPYLFLRLGLGLALITTGIGLFIKPEIWTEYINIKPLLNFNQNNWHKIISASSFLLGTLIITNKMTKLTAWITIVFLFLITINNKLNIILPSNIGLLGMTLAIAMWPNSYHKKKHWWNRKNKPNKTDEE